MKPELRPATRPAYCRACDENILKGTDMVSWYSYRNRGMYIHLCLACAMKLGHMARGHIVNKGTIE